jgi:hypothetical protein
VVVDRDLSDTPDQIDLGRHRDLVGRGRAVWFRRGVVAVLVAIPCLALGNVFGQRAGTSNASSQTNTLSVSTPSSLRSGLIYQLRITVDAPAGLNDPRLALSSGWLDGITLNTLEPAVSNETSVETSVGGGLQLSLRKIAPGHRFVLFMQFQVNPTTAGHRSVKVVLTNGTTRVLSIHRTLTIFP